MFACVHICLQVFMSTIIFSCVCVYACVRVSRIESLHVFICLHVFMSSRVLVFDIFSIIYKRCGSLRTQKLLEAQLACQRRCVITAFVYSASKHSQTLLQIARRTLQQERLVGSTYEYYITQAGGA